MCIQNLVKFCLLVLKILSGNKILTSIKGHNSVANLRKMTLYNPKIDLINVNVYAKMERMERKYGPQYAFSNKNYVQTARVFHDLKMDFVV